MFEFIRSHTRLMLGLLLLLIIPSFVFFGVEGYARFMEEGGRAVAKVDGRDVTRSEWDAAHERMVRRMREQRPGVDLALIDNPEMKRRTLDALVRDRVLLAAAHRQALAPGDERLQRLFVSDPQFAGLRNPDGSVNRDILAAQGMSSEMFEQQLRQEIGMRQVVAGVVETAFAPAAAASASLGALLQRREAQAQVFPLAEQLAKVNPTDADLEAYYKANEASFQAPEQARIEYVVLDLDALTRSLTVGEKELRDYYEQNASRFTVAEERRASHILITADASAPAAERAKARERAEALLAEVRRNPGSFADVARRNSQDPGSAARGGDLDFNGRGLMVKPFDDAMFAMKEGEISNLVETEYGFHIIRLTGVRGGQRQPFEAVRGQLEGEVRRALAQRQYADAAEKFTNKVYELPDSLQPVIDELKLEKRTATVQRTPPSDATGPLASRKLLEAIFSGDVLREKRNSQAIEVGSNQLASARLVEHQPARLKALSEVRDEVRTRVVRSQAMALARKAGEERLAAVQKAPDTALPETLQISRATAQGLPRPIVDAVLQASPAALPLVRGVEVPEFGYVVLKVTRVLPRESQIGGDGPLLAQYAQAWGGAEAQAYLDALKVRYKAQVVESRVKAALPATPATP